MDATPPRASAPVAELRGASKSYGAVQALSAVDFSIAHGEVRALLGKNGAGKSTMIRMLAGAESPDTGEVLIGGTALANGGIEGARRLGVRTVYQELSLIGSMSVAENMFMGAWPTRSGGISYTTMNRLTRTALDRLGLRIDPGREVASLPVADQQMVEIARALQAGPRLLILDEPTSSLAAAEVDRVLETVRTIASTGVSVIYVSHRLSEIRQIADAASIMRDGRLIDTRSLAEVDTAEVVHMMIGSTVNEVRPVATPADPNASVAMELRGITIEPLLHDVDLDVRVGEVLGIAGVLGSGRTEMLRVMAAIDKPAAGTVRVGGSDITGRGIRVALRHGIGMTPENRKELGIFPALSLAENMVISRWDRVSRAGILSPATIASKASDLIRRLQVKAASPAVEIGTLSGGNQQKAVIGRWLHAGSTTLLLDEPTRGVDVEAKAQIYALVRELAAQGNAVVFVSSEVEELPSVCDRVVVIRDGRLGDEFRAPDIDADRLLASTIAADETSPKGNDL